ncbi:23S rRNA (adenine(2030)-N(6))-methyltransferase RlmJ [Psychrobacter sp. FDAARGOS_221]|uniref:23S rRNA (adenine(2030)-N(6))-methyltransferase RlmJ n=1 Tax=Psychrobacter sp. FDAARGOS_221 TaxID=1975705 RepID=UPI000BB59010|nr:23S rRNA (adenine(2030)-N(6))-methyltransferase RlmJ [Psychrobacter sp. FDAARGOS_221]PNK60112.1 23S rRNA (adenine(2030)-N(6))-methyltransferase RlmJ [Psychrobacter sp. FDAARGOS_221]
MNYKHAYHAGNFADVVKHILLIQLLNQMSSKGKPFYALDAYGGRGLYSLSSEESRKTKEAQAGVQKILDADLDQAPDAVRQYVDDIAQAKQTYDKHVYPGSPWWIANHVEKNPDIQVRAEAFEFKNSEYDALNYQLYKLPIGIHNRNAFEGIPAVIPPVERRGVILIDPPYEQEHKDFSSLVDLLVASVEKWPQGVYALWFPIKNIEAVELFYKKMKRTEIRKQLLCELNVYPNDVAVGLNGTGMLIINPPWQFDRHAREILNFLQPLLRPEDAPQMPQSQAVGVRWLVGE